MTPVTAILSHMYDDNISPVDRADASVACRHLDRTAQAVLFLRYCVGLSERETAGRLLISRRQVRRLESKGLLALERRLS